MSSTPDIIIAGAGPAGIATSIFLSKKGIRHTILEKSALPRDKICGDALSGKVVELLQEIDPNFVDQCEGDTSHFLGSYGVRFVAPNGKVLDIPFKKNLEDLQHAPGYLSKRFHFDHWLSQKIDNTYATLIQNATITSIERTGNQSTIRYLEAGTEKLLKADLVIGCEGDRSIVAKTLGGIRKENNHYCAGLRAYYEGVTGFHPKNFIELHFIRDVLPGYVWIFPLPNGGANVGVGMLSKEVSRKKVNLKSVLEEVIHKHPEISERFKHARLTDAVRGWGLPLGSKKRRISGDGFLLTGDAASLIDPFTGEGIGNAMVSGKLAASMVEASINANRFDSAFLKHYDKMVYEKLWDELKLSHTLQRLTNYEGLFNFVVNKAAKNLLLQETITGMFDDLSMRSRLKRPGFYFQLLFR